MTKKSEKKGLFWGGVLPPHKTEIEGAAGPHTSVSPPQKFGPLASFAHFPGGKWGGPELQKSPFFDRFWAIFGPPKKPQKKAKKWPFLTPGTLCLRRRFAWGFGPLWGPALGRPNSLGSLGCWPKYPHLGARRQSSGLALGNPGPDPYGGSASSGSFAAG